MCLYSWNYIVNHNENEDENEKKIIYIYIYNINRRRSRNGHKFNKYKKCLSMMMPICTEQYLSNI